MYFLVFILIFFNQTTEIDTSKITFDFIDVDVRDVLRAIGIQTGVNIVVDKSVEGTITVHLEKVGLTEGLGMMLKANGYALEQRENYFFVKKMEKERRKEISATKDRITLDVKNIPADELIRDIATQSKINMEKGGRSLQFFRIYDISINSIPPA